MNWLDALYTIGAAAALLVVALPLPGAADEAAEAKATIEAKSGSTVTGTAAFTEVPNGVKVVVDIENFGNIQIGQRCGVVR